MKLKQSNNDNSYWAKSAATFDKTTNKTIEALVDRIKKDIGHADLVLDVAAGTGIVSLELAKSVKHVDALDLESEMIAVAQKKADELNITNLSFHIQSAYKLDFLDHIFDAVVILNSLHVMKTPDLALNEARRVLKSTGLLIAPTYCHAETKGSLDNYQKWSLKSGHESHHLFTCDSLCELICSCGLCINKRETVVIKHENPLNTMMLGYVVACPI